MPEREKRPRWTIPREWCGETAAIIGGGPSLRKEDIDCAIARGWRRIAVNNAYLLDLEADVLVWGDRRWYSWNGADLQKHKGRYKITWQQVNSVGGYKFHTLRYAGMPPELRQFLNDLRQLSDERLIQRVMESILRYSNNVLAEDPGTIAATNTGQGALNVAYHFGAKRIVLFGFDMQMVRVDGKLKHNWHDLHRRDTDAGRYHEVFGPSIQVAAAILARKEIEVVNCTPGSQLRGVPIRRLEDL